MYPRTKQNTLASREALGLFTIFGFVRVEMPERIESFQHIESLRREERHRHAGRQPRDFDERLLKQTRRVLAEDFDLMRRALDQQERGNFVWTQHSILQARDERKGRIDTC
ncbi:protein of unknown function (plasmid) [Caballeronia sp. S22]